MLCGGIIGSPAKVRNGEGRGFRALWRWAAADEAAAGGVEQGLSAVSDGDGLDLGGGGGDFGVGLHGGCDFWIML